MFRRDIHKGSILAVIVVFLMAAVVVTVPSEDSDAAVSEWYSYGHHLVFTDRSYNPVKYSSISWEYSKTVITETEPGTVVSGDPDNNYSYVLDLNPVDFPFQVVTPLFVKEIAYMSTGEVKTASFIVNVNPIKEVCYFRFMYDEENGYMYEPVTYGMNVEVGKDPMVNLPIDPARDGYTFGGWYYDKECTKSFDRMYPEKFTTETEIPVYPKWIPNGGGDVPVSDVRFVTLHMVDGLYMEHDGMAVSNGLSFTFTVSVMDGFKFDISDMKAVTSDGQVLSQRNNPDGSITFTLGSVTSDTTVMLTGYKQYFRVALYGEGISTVGFDDWVLQGSSLTLPLRSDSGDSVDAAVFMAGVDVTGNTFSDGTVRIISVDGDVSIYASSVEMPSSSDGGIDMWMYISIAAIIIALVLAIVLIRRYRSG